jgi:hypothetical protein
VKDKHSSHGAKEELHHLPHTECVSPKQLCDAAPTTARRGAERGKDESKYGEEESAGLMMLCGPFHGFLPGDDLAGKANFAL